MTKPRPLNLEDWFEIVEEGYDTHKQKEWIEIDIETWKKLKNDLKQRLKSACEFWLRYRDNPILLWKEKPKFRKLIKKESWCDVDGPDLHSDEDMQDYNLWLFKLAFNFKEEIEK